MVQLMGLLPIRKVTTNKVALTSYYGKTFVTRARKNADDYGQWLLAKVTLKALDRTDMDIIQAAYANVFEQTLICPRAYSSIAKGIKSFFCNDYTLDFDRETVLTTYPEAILKKYEKHHAVIMGVDSLHQNYLLLDMVGNVFAVPAEDGEVKALGDIDSFLGLDPFSAPVESVSAGIFGKDIPLAMILSLELGLEKLLALLKAEPVRIPSSDKYKLKADE